MMWPILLAGGEKTMMIRASACAGFILLLLESAISAQVIVKDEKSFFEAVVPADWKVSRPSDVQEAGHQRYRAVAPDNQRRIIFYVFEEHRDINLDELDQLVSFLGQVSSERKISNSVIERRYKPGTSGVYEAARFQVDGPNGYLVLAMSSSPDLSFADGVFQTFAVKTPMTTRLLRFGRQWWARNESRGKSSPPLSFSDVAGLLLFLAAYCGFLYLLTRAGVCVRRGVEKMKVFKRLLVDASSSGITLGPRFKAERRKATLKILGPVLGLGSYAYFAYMFLPSFWKWTLLGHLLFPAIWFFNPNLKISQEEQQDAASELASTALENLWE
jgi:hypothetical protein